MPNATNSKSTKTLMSSPKTQSYRVTANEWFAIGDRVPYDPIAKKIMPKGSTNQLKDTVHVYTRIVKDETQEETLVWSSFLPGWPDGSFGWAETDKQLAGKQIGHRLFFDYVGFGESDKPNNYPYGLKERADLVEALWRAEGIESTFIYAFDYSSFITMELLTRQQDRLDAGDELATRIEGVLLMNGGLYVEGHTHPWFTTPILKSWMGGMVTSLGQRSELVFSELMKPVFSKKYNVTKRELHQIYNAISRRNGVYTMSKTAGFLKDHFQNAERLNLSHIYRKMRGTVSFHVVGSQQDIFEGMQAVLAKERLGPEGLDVRIIPGGHLSTAEQPELLAQIIEDVGPSSSSFLAKRAAHITANIAAAE